MRKEALLLLGIVSVALVAGCVNNQAGTGENQSVQTSASGACPDMKNIGAWIGFNGTQRYLLDTGSYSFGGYVLQQTSCCQYKTKGYTPCELGTGNENTSNYYCKGIVGKKYDESGNLLDTKTFTIVLTNKLGYIETLC